MATVTSANWYILKSFKSSPAAITLPVKPFKQPVGLEAIKKDKILKEMKLVKIGRLSVSPVTKEQYGRIMELSE